MDKVYCKECKYCDTTHYWEEYYKCARGDGDWYSRGAYTNCQQKNENNDCSDFEPKLSILLKQWIIKLISPRK